MSEFEKQVLGHLKSMDESLKAIAANQLQSTLLTQIQFRLDILARAMSYRSVDAALAARRS